jgi:hypothetical protein
LARYLDEKLPQAAPELDCAKTSEHAGDEGGGGRVIREGALNDRELTQSSLKNSEKSFSKNFPENSSDAVDGEA